MASQTDSDCGSPYGNATFEMTGSSIPEAAGSKLCWSASRVPEGAGTRGGCAKLRVPDSTTLRSLKKLGELVQLSAWRQKPTLPDIGMTNGGRFRDTRTVEFFHDVHNDLSTHTIVAAYV